MKRVRKMIREGYTRIKFIINMLISRLYIVQKGCVEEVIYKGRKLPLYLSEYNCGMSCKKRLTERALELALAKDWGGALEGDYVEIGAVTPYYSADFLEHSVIDPFDAHEKVDIKKSLFECDYSGKNVLSISTIEHVGTGDYGLSKAESCIDALNKILEESKSCLISFPMGYNNKLDNYVLKMNFPDTVSVNIYGRSKFGNDWKIISEQKKAAEYVYGPLWANCVCFIEK